MTERDAANWLDLDVFKLLRGWEELQATWNQATNGVAWTTAGANGSGDREGARRARARVNTAPGGTVSFDLTSLAQDWVSSPAGNRGLLLRPTLPVNSMTMTYRFASANHWDPAWRPKLMVTYTSGGQAHSSTGRVSGHASLTYQSAPAATPPANHTWRTYYDTAGRRVAMRVQDGTTGANQVHFLFADHLGSTNVSYQAGGGQTVVQRYYPWGSVRPGPNNALPTGYTYTGQLDSGLGLMYYGARFYDGALGRFVQPDTIVPEPGNPQALNRYAYALNRPTVLVDPTGHVAHLNCQGSGAAIADCGVDSWYGYEDYTVRKQLRAMGQREGDKVAKALIDLTSIFAEPLDYIATLGACVSGDCSVLALGAMVLPMVPGAVGRHADEVAEIASTRLYRSASGTADSLTPRPGFDDVPGGGLSFFDSVENPGVKPGKVVEIDSGRLRSLQVKMDNDPPGHVTVRPDSDLALQDWAASRSTGVVHPFTHEILDAVMRIFKK